MTFTASTAAEASALAAELRALHADTDFEVTVVAPLFDGDSYRVNVT